MKAGRMRRGSFLSIRGTTALASVVLLLACGARGASSVQKGNSVALRAMARIYMSHGDYSKAQPLAEHALALAKSQEDNDREISACLIDLGWLYKSRGRLGDAEVMCELGLQLQQAAYYKDHPYVAYTLRILGSIYQQRSRYVQAADAFDRATTIMSKYHRPDDPVLAPLQVDRARLLAAQGRFYEAESYYCSAFETVNNAFGPDHPYTAGVVVNIADLYAKLGRLDEAEQLIGRALAIQERVYGCDNHLLAPTYLTLARIHHARADYGRAESFAATALILVDAKLDAANPLAGEAFALLAETWFDDGRLDEAEQAGLYALAAMGADGSGSAMAMNTLARVYIVQGRYDEAEQFALRANAALAGILDSDHPNIKEVRHTIALVEQSRAGSARHLRVSSAVEVLTKNKAWLVIESGLSRLLDSYRQFFFAGRPAAKTSPAHHQTDV